MIYTLWLPEACELWDIDGDALEPAPRDYKDEIYVAHLATSVEKERRDHARYNIDPARGDRLTHSFIMRPHFEILGADVKFDLSPKPWMLNVMRRLRFLRGWLPQWQLLQSQQCLCQGQRSR